MEKEDLSQIWNPVAKKYKIQKILGTGSFGTVVKAKDRLSGKKYAIKLIKDV